MKKDENMPIGKVKKVEDFLPSPDKLILPEKTISVTLRIEEKSLRFFKEQAKKNHTKYQTMIKSVLDRYAQKYSEMK